MFTSGTVDDWSHAGMLAALSIRQPWAELILQGRKTIEVRTWATQHRGELWLHAGAVRDGRALRRFDLPAADLTVGALIGKCELYDCIEFSAATWDLWRTKHLNDGSHKKGQYAWLLRDPRRILPLPFKGRLGLMRIDLSDI